MEWLLVPGRWEGFFCDDVSYLGLTLSLSLSLFLRVDVEREDECLCMEAGDVWRQVGKVQIYYEVRGWGLVVKGGRGGGGRYVE